jgi:hypothetical protein
MEAAKAQNWAVEPQEKNRPHEKYNTNTLFEERKNKQGSKKQ